MTTTEMQAFALDVMGAADTIEVMAGDDARRTTSVANAMARQIRERAARVLAHTPKT
jgi:hypothetical protein